MFIIDDGDGRQSAWLLPYPAGGKPPRRLPLKLLYDFNGSPQFDWVPDSRHIVVSLASDLSSPNHLWMADTESDDMTPVTGGTEGQEFPMVAPDGRRVIYSQSSNHVSVISVSVIDGSHEPLIETTHEESMASWSSSTKKLVWVSNRNGPYEIWLREADGSERPVVTAADFPPGTNKWFLAPAISPDGERIIYQRVDSSGVSRLWISSLSGGAPLRLTNMEPDSEMGGSWSPDGSRFVYTQEKGGKIALMMVKSTGNATPEALKDWGEYNAIPDWSPSGDWITFQDDKGWHLISPDGKTSKSLGKITTNFIAFSRDGKLLYGLHLGEPGPGPDLSRGILFSLDPVTLKQTVIRDLGRSFVPSAKFGPGIRFSFGPDGKSFAFPIVNGRADWWILQGLPQPGWRERLRSWFRTDSPPKDLHASSQARP